MPELRQAKSLNFYRSYLDPETWNCLQLVKEFHHPGWDHWLRFAGAVK
jgi:hypothetical protein